MKELYRVMIHGILHLIGYDDQNDEEKAEMNEKENYYLERLENLF
ncbi:rRNA maturation RNase YbeY [Bacteroidota bacterium]